MQYFVIAPDGNRYGPADMNLLRQWVAEHRITPETMLEDMSTGQRMPATSIDGLFYVAVGYGPMPGAGAPNYSQPVSPAQYPRGYGDDSHQHITWAYVCFALGVAICAVAPITSAIGLSQANKAIEKGNPNGATARVLNIVMLVLGILVWVFYILLFALGFSGALD